MLISKIKKIFGGRVITKDTEDAVNYYNLVVELSRGRNDIVGHRGITENQAKRLLSYRSIPFDEEEFNRAYEQFKAARISRAAFQKGVDSKTGDEQIHAPKGGVSIKGKEFKGGEFIPKEGGYQEEYKKQQKEGTASKKKDKKEKIERKKSSKKMKANKEKVAKLKAKLKNTKIKGSRKEKDINAKRDKDGNILMATGGLPEHLQHIAIPPAWKTFIINPNKKSKCWVVGFDENGKINGRVYSPEHEEERNFKKDSMLSDLNKNLPKVWKQIDSDMNSKGKFQKALIAKIMTLTGARVGSSEKALGKKGLTYGVSTLEGRHIVSENGGVKLDFIGKDSKQNIYRIRDEQTVKMLLQLKKKAGDKGRLFDEKYIDILDYVKGLDGGGFTPKSFRTRIGTDAAIKNIQKMKAPTNPKEYKKAVKAVAKQVAEKLNNTPTIALKSYIVPSVWQNWKMEAGVE